MIISSEHDETQNEVNFFFKNLPNLTNFYSYVDNSCDMIWMGWRRKDWLSQVICKLYIINYTLIFIYYILINN